MKHEVWKTGLVMAVVTVIAGSAAFAAAGAPAASKAPAVAAPEHTELFCPELWKTLHDPTPWLHMGLDFRFRTEYGENFMTLDDDHIDHEREYQRYRARWWTKWTLSEDISFNTRLTWEFRTWDEPRTQDVNFNADEAVFDWFNVNLKNLGGAPLTATLGRQDIMDIGVGWLILDGSCGDGSRTAYFDAVRATYDWADASSKVDVILISQVAESNRRLNLINDQEKAIVKSDETGAILYVTNKSFNPTQLEGFFIYKNDNPVDGPLEGLANAWSRKSEIFTFGGAISGLHAEHWKYRAEGAIQTGTKHDPGFHLNEKDQRVYDLSIGEERDLEAYGALATLEYLFKDSHANVTHLTYEYASGDDADSHDNEQFDPLWGEWPRWSEMLGYTAAYETSPFEMTNLHRLNIGHKFDLNKQWTLTADYHALWADETGSSSRYEISNGDKFRGSLVTAWAKFKFSSQLYGHLMGEYFFPGAYYGKGTDDEAFWLRVNVEYVF